MSIITIKGAGSPLWSLIWRTIQTHNRVYVSVAQRTTEREGLIVLRKFFRLWDPIYFEAMEINARGGAVPDERIRRLVKSFTLAREGAWRIGLGVDDRGVFYPKIDDKTTRALRAYRTYGPIPLTVSGEAMKPVPESFHGCCQVCISPDHVLALTCDVQGKRYATTIDLKPIAERVKEMIRRYHEHVLHGDMQRETIAGLGDWYRDSVRAAARIAHAKAAKRLWAKVQAHHGAIEGGLSTLGPFGQAAAITVRTGLTIQKMLTKAKDGDRQAIGDVKAIVALSKQGDPSARQVTGVMKAMNEMGKIKEEKIGGWWWNRPYRVAAISPDMALRGFYNLGVVS